MREVDGTVVTRWLDALDVLCLSHTGWIAGDDTRASLAWIIIF
jgi:hypothetical protein